MSSKAKSELLVVLFLYPPNAKLRYDDYHS